jgi:hypothetical protein
MMTAGPSGVSGDSVPSAFSVKAHIFAAWVGGMMGVVSEARASDEKASNKADTAKRNLNIRFSKINTSRSQASAVKILWIHYRKEIEKKPEKKDLVLQKGLDVLPGII